MRNLLSLTQVIDATYDIYRKYMKSFIGYTTLSMLVTTSIMYGVMIVVGIVFLLIFLLLSTAFSFTGGENPMVIIILCIGFFILMLPAFSVMQLVAAGPIHGVEEIKKGNGITFGKMFNYSFKKIGYVITSTLAYSLVFIGIIGLGGFVYFIVYTFVLVQTFVALQVGAAIVIGLIVLIGCCWFGINGALYLPVALCEKRHFFGAISGSFRLVEGQFKRMLGIIFSFSLSYFMIYLSLGGLSSVASNLLPLLLSGLGNAGALIGIFLLQMLLLLVQLAVSVVVAPIQYITIPIIYFNERNRRYGDDLHNRLNELIRKQEAIAQ